MSNPTKLEIRRACQKIRANETDKQLAKRAARSGSPVRVNWTIPIISTQSFRSEAEAEPPIE